MPPLNIGQRSMHHSKPSDACNHPLHNISVLRSAISESLFWAFPDIEYDTLRTVPRSLPWTVSLSCHDSALHSTAGIFRLFVSATRKNAYVLYIISELGITGTSDFAALQIMEF